MIDKLSTRQRELMHKKKGKPTLALEFDAFPDGSVSMWAHTRRDIPFAEMKRAFEAIRDHISSFIDDGDMCPFNPNFLKESPHAHP